MKRTFYADSIFIFILTTILIWPLFRLEYSAMWESIESTFISDARMLSEHWPHTGWQPLWYCGTRFDYVYPPALRYGTALISIAAHLSTARAYHLYTAIFYVFGIVAIYWMVRIGTSSRVSALLASAATALLSPSFLFLRETRHDSLHWIPQRVHVLTAWGEGPHISALCILPAALAASFLALRKGRSGAFAAAGVFCAIVVANNFYGATALAIFFPILVWSVWIGEQDWRAGLLVVLRAAGIAGLAYGLSAFWLTPSYVGITLTDLHWVARPGNSFSRLTLIVIAALFCLTSFRMARGRPEREWTVFAAGAAVILILDVLGFFYFGLLIAGDAHRLIPELDLALILAGVEIGRVVWKRPRWRVYSVAAIVIVFGFSSRYLRHAWSPFVKSGSMESQYPYQIAKWVHDRIPGERVLPTGEARFWFDAWFNNPETNGGSDQGMLNQELPAAFWQIMTGTQADLSIAWLKALGTDAVIVPDEQSLEHYRTDYAHPHKFSGAARVLYDDGHGTVVYRIPRLYPNIVRIVNRDAIGRVGEIHAGDDAQRLGNYLAAIENPAQAESNIAWKGFDEAEIGASSAAGESVLFQETYDPAWHAYESGKALPVRRDRTMGFMLIDVPQGSHKIRMHFETPPENRAGEILSVLSLTIVAGLLILSGINSASARQAVSGRASES